jgi:hypothetical protein
MRPRGGAHSTAGLSPRTPLLRSVVSAISASWLATLTETRGHYQTATTGWLPTGFTMYDLERLQAMRFSGMADLENSIRRVIAMRTWGVTAGARRLGLKHSSLSQWARNKNRKLST